MVHKYLLITERLIVIILFLLGRGCLSHNAGTAETNLNVTLTDLQFTTDTWTTTPSNQTPHFNRETHSNQTTHSNEQTNSNEQPHSNDRKISKRRALRKPKQGDVNDSQDVNTTTASIAEVKLEAGGTSLGISSTSNDKTPISTETPTSHSHEQKPTSQTSTANENKPVTKLSTVSMSSSSSSSSVEKLHSRSAESTGSNDDKESGSKSTHARDNPSAPISNKNNDHTENDVLNSTATVKINIGALPTVKPLVNRNAVAEHVTTTESSSKSAATVPTLTAASSTRENMEATSSTSSGINSNNIAEQSGQTESIPGKPSAAINPSTKANKTATSTSGPIRSTVTNDGPARNSQISTLPAKSISKTTLVPVTNAKEINSSLKSQSNSENTSSTWTQSTMQVVLTTGSSILSQNGEHLMATSTPNSATATAAAANKMREHSHEVEDEKVNDETRPMTTSSPSTSTATKNRNYDDYEAAKSTKNTKEYGNSSSETNGNTHSTIVINDVQQSSEESRLPVSSVDSATPLGFNQSPNSDASQSNNAAATASVFQNNDVTTTTTTSASPKNDARTPSSVLQHKETIDGNHLTIVANSTQHHINSTTHSDNTHIVTNDMSSGTKTTKTLVSPTDKDIKLGHQSTVINSDVGPQNNNTAPLSQNNVTSHDNHVISSPSADLATKMPASSVGETTTLDHQSPNSNNASWNNNAATSLAFQQHENTAATSSASQHSNDRTITQNNNEQTTSDNNDNDYNKKQTNKPNQTTAGSHLMLANSTHENNSTTRSRNATSPAHATIDTNNMPTSSSLETKTSVSSIDEASTLSHQSPSSTASQSNSAATTTTTPLVSQQLSSSSATASSASQQNNINASTTKTTTTTIAGLLPTNETTVGSHLMLANNKTSESNPTMPSQYEMLPTAQYRLESSKSSNDKISSISDQQSASTEVKFNHASSTDFQIVGSTAVHSSNSSAETKATTTTTTSNGTSSDGTPLMTTTPTRTASEHIAMTTTTQTSSKNEPITAKSGNVTTNKGIQVPSPVISKHNTSVTGHQGSISTMFRNMSTALEKQTIVTTVSGPTSKSNILVENTDMNEESAASTATIGLKTSPINSLTSANSLNNGLTTGEMNSHTTSTTTSSKTATTNMNPIGDYATTMISPKSAAPSKEETIGFQSSHASSNIPQNDVTDVDKNQLLTTGSKASTTKLNEETAAAHPISALTENSSSKTDAPFDGHFLTTSADLRLSVTSKAPENSDTATTANLHAGPHAEVTIDGNQQSTTGRTSSTTQKISNEISAATKSIENGTSTTSASFDNHLAATKGTQSNLPPAMNVTNVKSSDEQTSVTATGFQVPTTRASEKIDATTMSKILHGNVTMSGDQITSTTEATGNNAMASATHKTSAKNETQFGNSDAIQMVTGTTQSVTGTTQSVTGTTQIVGGSMAGNQMGTTETTGNNAMTSASGKTLAKNETEFGNAGITEIVTGTAETNESFGAHLASTPEASLNMSTTINPNTLQINSSQPMRSFEASDGLSTNQTSGRATTSNFQDAEVTGISLEANATMSADKFTSGRPTVESISDHMAGPTTMSALSNTSAAALTTSMTTTVPNSGNTISTTSVPATQLTEASTYSARVPTSSTENTTEKNVQINWSSNTAQTVDNISDTTTRMTNDSSTDQTSKNVTIENDNLLNNTSVTSNQTNLLNGPKNASVPGGNITATSVPSVAKPEVITCRAGKVFCLQQWQCVPSQTSFLDPLTYPMDGQTTCKPGEAFCEKSESCQQVDDANSMWRKHTCKDDEVFCLDKFACGKCDSILDNVAEMPFPLKTPSPIKLPANSDMCPSGEVYPLPVDIFCRNHSDCPLQSRCCHMSTSNKKNLPHCVWIADFNQCPSFMHYCAATSKCHLPTIPCGQICPDGWDFCSENNKCVETGTCNNATNQTDDTFPFFLPDLPVPNLTITPLKPKQEDEEVLFEASEVFTFMGDGDFTLKVKEKFLLQFLEDYLSIDHNIAELKQWMANFSSFLSVKSTQLEIGETGCTDLSADTDEDLFPCGNGVVIQVADSSNVSSQTWSSHCVGAGIRVRRSQLIRLKLKPNYNGQVTFNVAPVILNVRGQTYGGRDLVTANIVTVLPSNDGPRLRREVKHLETEIPFIMTMSSPETRIKPGSGLSVDQGTKVGDIVSTFYRDPDDDGQLGMALISAQASPLGHWQYQMANSQWIDLDNMDVTATIVKDLQIGDNVQGVLQLLEGSSSRSSAKENAKFRQRRDIIFLEDTTNSNGSMVAETEANDMKGNSTGPTRPYSADFMNLINSPFGQTSSIESDTSVAINSSDILQLQLMAMPWRERKPFTDKQTECVLSSPLESETTTVITTLVLPMMTKTDAYDGVIINVPTGKPSGPATNYSQAFETQTTTARNYQTTFEAISSKSDVTTAPADSRASTQTSGKNENLVEAPITVSNLPPTSNKVPESESMKSTESSGQSSTMPTVSNTKATDEQTATTPLAAMISTSNVQEATIGNSANQTTTTTTTVMQEATIRHSTNPTTTLKQNVTVANSANPPTTSAMQETTIRHSTNPTTTTSLMQEATIINSANPQTTTVMQESTQTGKVESQPLILNQETTARDGDINTVPIDTILGTAIETTQQTATIPTGNVVTAKQLESITTKGLDENSMTQDMTADAPPLGSTNGNSAANITEVNALPTQLPDKGTEPTATQNSVQNPEESTTEQAHNAVSSNESTLTTRTIEILTSGTGESAATVTKLPLVEIPVGGFTDAVTSTIGADIRWNVSANSATPEAVLIPTAVPMTYQTSTSASAISSSSTSGVPSSSVPSADHQTSNSSTSGVPSSSVPSAVQTSDFTSGHTSSSTSSPTNLSSSPAIGMTSVSSSSSNQTSSSFSTGMETPTSGSNSASVTSSVEASSPSTTTSSPATSGTPEPIFYEVEQPEMQQIISYETVVLFLPPAARLRFVPLQIQNTPWTLSDALRQTKLIFGAWDGSKNETPGSSSKVKLELCSATKEDCTSNNSISGQLVVVHHGSADCTGQLPLHRARQTDECKICGGDSTRCLDCENTVNGGNKLDCNLCSAKEVRDCAMSCNRINELVSPSPEVSNEVCHLVSEPSLRRCNSKSNSSFVNVCGTCVDGADSVDTDYPPKDEKHFCGSCSNDIKANVLQTQYQHFYCNNTFRRDALTEVVAFGGLPHLNWHEISGSAQTVHLDMAAPTLLHFYGPTWSYKRETFNYVTCQVQSIDRKRQLTMDTTLEEDRMTMRLTLNHTSLGDYSMDCNLHITESTHHAISPIAKLSVVDSRLQKVYNVIPESIAMLDTTINVTVTLNGSGFVNSNHMWCFYTVRPSSHARLLSMAQYVSANQVTCNVTNILANRSSMMDIGVLISSSALTKLNQEPGAFSTATLQIYGEPPKGVTTEFSFEKLSFIIKFNHNIQAKNCSHIFTNMNAWNFDVGRCKVETNRLIIPVTLATSYLELPTLELRPFNGITTTFAPDDSSDAIGSIEFGNTVNKNYMPNFKINGPSQVCGGDFTYRVILTPAMLRDHYTLRWSVTVEDSENATQSANRIQYVASTFNEKEYQFTFGSEMMMPNVTYTIDATLFDKLNGQRQTVSRSLTYVPLAHFTLNIEGPLNVDPRYAAHFRAKPSVCPALQTNSTPQYTFYWEIDTDEVSLSLIRGKFVTIENGQLEGGQQYAIRCLAVVNGDLATKTIAEFNFKTKMADPVIVVTPVRMSVHAKQTFQLDASKSHDPYKNQDRLRFYWNCRTTKGGGCYYVNGTEILRLETMYAKAMQRPMLKLDGNVLPVGNYIFHVEIVTADGRNASEDVSVDISNSLRAPQVRIIQGSSVELEPNTAVTLRALVTAAAGTTLTWEGVHEAGYSLFDTSSTRSRGWYSHLASDTREQPVSVTLQPNASRPEPWLHLNPSSEYNIRLTATHPTDGTTFAEIRLKTTSDPASATPVLKVSPLCGTAILTPFTVNLTDFLNDLQDKQASLFIGFKPVTNGNGVGKERILRQVMDSDFVIKDFRLPAIPYKFKQLVIIAKACQPENVCSTAESQPIEIELPQRISKSDYGTMLTSVTSLMKKGDPDAALQQAISCMQTLQVSGFNISSETFKVFAKLVEVIIQRVTTTAQIRLRWGYSSRETAMTILRTIFDATVEINAPSKPAIMSMLDLHSEVLDVISEQLLSEISDLVPTNDTDTNQREVTPQTTQHRIVKRRSRALKRRSGNTGIVPKGYQSKSPKVAQQSETSNLKIQTSVSHKSSFNASGKNSKPYPKVGSKNPKKYKSGKKATRQKANSDANQRSTKKVAKVSSMASSNSSAQHYNATSMTISRRNDQNKNETNDDDDDVTMAASENLPIANFNTMSMKKREYLTSKQVETLLRSTEPISLYDKDLIGTLDERLMKSLPDIWLGMCSMVAIGGDILKAMSSHVVLQAWKADVNTVLSGQQKFTITDSSLSDIDVRRASSGFEYQYIIGKNESTVNLKCGGEKPDCGIVCSGSAKYREDPLLSTAYLASEAMEKNRRSGILITWGMIQTDVDAVDILAITNSILLNISINQAGLTKEEIPFLKCASLDTRQWKTSLCNTTRIVTSRVRTTVSCSCDASGYYGAFLEQSNKPIIPIADNTQEADESEVTIPTVSPPSVLRPEGPVFAAEHLYDITFTLTGDYDKSVTPVGVHVFAEHMKKQLADMFNVTIHYFPNVHITRGSIKVDVRVTPDPNGPYGGGHNLLMQMQRMISNTSTCFVGIARSEQLCTTADSFAVDWIDDNQGPLPTTSPQQTITTTVKSFTPLHSCEIFFVLLGNYLTSVEEVGKHVFIDSIRTQLVAMFGVTVNYFPYINVEKGSIEVTMMVTPDPDGPYGNGNELVTKMQHLISTGDLCFKGVNGENLCAKKDSYAMKWSSDGESSQKCKPRSERKWRPQIDEISCVLSTAQDDNVKKNHFNFGRLVLIIFAIIIGSIALCVILAIRKRKRRNKINAINQAIANQQPVYRNVEQEEAALENTLLEGTIDSRQQYQMKLEGAGSEFANATPRKGTPTFTAVLPNAPNDIGDGDSQSISSLLQSDPDTSAKDQQLPARLPVTGKPKSNAQPLVDV